MWWLKIRDFFNFAGLNRPAPTGRQGKTAAEPPAHQAVWLPSLLAGLVVLLLHLVLFPPIPRTGVDFPGVGELAERKITAEFSFDVQRPEKEIQDERSRLVWEVPPVLIDTPGPAGSSSRDRLQIWLDYLGNQLSDTTTTREEKISLLRLQYPDLDAGVLGWLLADTQPDSLLARMERTGQAILDRGVVDMLPAGYYTKVVIKGETREDTIDKGVVVASKGLEDRLREELQAQGMSPSQASRAAFLMRNFVTPNLIYSSRDTEAMQDLVRQSVPTKREFIVGEKIIDQGERVSEEQARTLDALRAVISARGGGDTLGRLTRSLIRGALVIMALGLFGWLGYLYFPGELRSVKAMITLTVIMALYLAGAAFALGRPALGTLAVPIVLCSLLAGVLYRDKVGFVFTLLAVSLLAVLPDFEAIHVFSWFILGMVTVISVRRIRKRGQFYRTMLLLTLVSVALILLNNLGAEDKAPGVYMIGLFFPALSVALGLSLLPMVEPVVGVCSDLTLLELSDLNHPLLQRMALEAQGTYHHSQVVGQLAEHAARAVDANSLLTRVGALFHDIGKMQKPEYYVENQNPDFNKHDELSPSMSALVISAHVKEGIELARKWRLPQAVIDFIPEHHGTMVMEYFYHKALNSEDGSPVKVDDFRYPGPKPRCRETAILMLADAVEAATRSLAKPTPSRIREITKQVIDKRMLSGELDESGLTLRDLARIRESFIPLLTGIHHARIVYPGQRDRDKERDPEKGGEGRGERKSRS
jgi:putative nucleotidyltransferase with HDIG domain